MPNDQSKNKATQEGNNNKTSAESKISLLKWIENGYVYNKDKRIKDPFKDEGYVAVAEGLVANGLSYTLSRKISNFSELTEDEVRQINTFFDDEIYETMLSMYNRKIDFIEGRREEVEHKMNIVRAVLDGYIKDNNVPESQKKEIQKILDDLTEEMDGLNHVIDILKTNPSILPTEFEKLDGENIKEEKEERQNNQNNIVGYDRDDFEGIEEKSIDMEIVDKIIDRLEAIISRLDTVIETLRSLVVATDEEIDETKEVENALDELGIDENNIETVDHSDKESANHNKTIEVKSSSEIENDLSSEHKTKATEKKELAEEQKENYYKQKALDEEIDNAMSLDGAGLDMSSLASIAPKKKAP